MANAQSMVEKWSKWNSDIHTNTEQIKRQDKALDVKCTPTFIDSDKCLGVFEGSKDQYQTTLENCTCFDFNHRKLPCKHMYRLAYELNVHLLKNKPSYGLTKNVALDILESLSEDAQKIVMNLLYLNIYHKNSLPVLYPKSNLVEELIISNLVIEKEDNLLKLKKKKKIDLLNYLTDEEKKSLKKKTTKSQLIEWIINNKTNLVNEICLESSILDINHNFKHLFHILYRHLIKKYR